jgi:hypothetical protein
METHWLQLQESYLCEMLTDFQSVFCVFLVSRSALRILINHFYILCMKYFVGVPTKFELHITSNEKIEHAENPPQNVGLSHFFDGTV